MRLSIALSKMILLVAMVLEFFAGFVIWQRAGWFVSLAVWSGMIPCLLGIAVLEGLEAIERGIKAERKLLQNAVRHLIAWDEARAEIERLCHHVALKEKEHGHGQGP